MKSDELKVGFMFEHRKRTLTVIEGPFLKKVWRGRGKVDYVNAMICRKGVLTKDELVASVEAFAARKINMNDYVLTSVKSGAEIKFIGDANV